MSAARFKEIVLQSVYGRIERLVSLVHCCPQTRFNRSMVELKEGGILLGARTLRRFNRSMVELKVPRGASPSLRWLGFNRSMVELKVRDRHRHDSRLFVLQSVYGRIERRHLVVQGRISNGASIGLW